MATKPEMPSQEMDAQRETLAGDLRDHLVGFVQHNGALTPWNKRAESDQREIVGQCSRIADYIIDQVVDLVASGGERSVTCSIKSVTGNDKGIDIKLTTLYSHDTWANLGDAKNVKLVVADSKDLQGERSSGADHVSPDQPDLVDEAEQAPVMDQTAAGKKAGGKPPKDVPAPEVPEHRAATQYDVKAIAAKIKPTVDAGANPDGQVAVAAQEMGIDIQSVTPQMLDEIMDIIGFEDPAPAENEAVDEGEDEPSAI